MASHSLTRGQQHILQSLCRSAYVLRATPSGSLSMVYTLTERDTGRHIQTLTPKMVTSLVDAGWLEREPGYPRGATTWTYRVWRRQTFHVMGEQKVCWHYREAQQASSEYGATSRPALWHAVRQPRLRWCGLGHAGPLRD